MEELTKKVYEEELKKLERIAQMAAEDLKDAPQGTLRISKDGSKVQYYWREDPKDTRGKYIRKSEGLLVKKLAQKDYAQKILAILEPTIKRRRKMLSQMNGVSVEKQMIAIYDKLSLLRQEMITPYIYSEDEFRKQWENEKQKMKEHQFTEPDSEIYTEKGECVRSKSEKILADKLYMMKVPYVYEVPLYLQGFGYIKPDFAVLNKRTQEEYYWEHFGMMGDSEYCEKAIRKIESYQKAGLFPGEKLLLTYETSLHPLNVKIVEGIVKKYLM